MSSYSPVSSPTVHVNNWSDQQVADWLAGIGLSKYAKEFKSNGITGDVLVLLDDDALKDIGVTTIGQRLSLLSATYRLKNQYGIPIQEGDWIPKSVEMQESHHTSLSVAQMGTALRQRDDRIRLLESQILRLADYLHRFQLDMATVARQVGVKAHSTETPITLVSNSLHSHHSSESSMGSMSVFGSSSDLASTAASLPLESPTSRNFAGLVSPSRAGFAYPSAMHARTGNQAHQLPNSAKYASESISHDDTAIPGGTASSHSYGHGHSSSFGGFKPHGLSTSSSSRALDGFTNSNTPSTPTSATLYQSHAGSSMLVGPTDLSPTQSTPSATPTSAAANLPQTQPPPPSSSSSLPSSNALVSPTRRLAHQNAAAAAAASTSTSSSSSTAGALDPSGSSRTRTTSAGGIPQMGGAAATSSSSEDRSTGVRNTSTNAASTPGPLSAPLSSSSSSSNAGNSDNNPYKSFRVTLDDPCYKVLPAALKKYKINDDWRKYALFICYGKTERCLSYDEKPLLLFQKLKENEQSPVFMLRHIRDVKSPIAIAEAKAASKSQEQQQGGASADGSASAATSAPSSTTALKKRSPPRNDGRRLVTGPLPPGTYVANAGNPVDIGPAADLAERNKQTRTYAVAIYPYMPERDDEFDVHVGDTFVVISKAKGWWIVQRDSKGDGAGDIVYSIPGGDGPGSEGGPPDMATSAGKYRAEVASGWVPAGCLLETSRPLGNIVEPASGVAVAAAGGRPRSGSTSTSGPSTPTVATTAAAAAERKASLTTTTSSVADPAAHTNSSSSSSGGGGGGNVKVDAKSASIPPALITSTSTPGIMLMDYQSSEGDLDLHKDERLRVFKRYNHWSYCVQERDPHARGWVPSWYIGKLSSSSSTSSATPGSVPPSSTSTSAVRDQSAHSLASSGTPAAKTATQLSGSSSDARSALPNPTSSLSSLSGVDGRTPASDAFSSADRPSQASNLPPPSKRDTLTSANPSPLSAGTGLDSK
ncbi:hypothetical protein BCV70DRAFT_197656 [Testicularia cyperi]|uniref:RA-domain-containing protein n=1 Tax=Testicularia cyperi TaxID=1882483 RepID=A0A317XYS9_9BASI|nr:hypothetical protein BCV70DRAFT_197656 [Testicularia cyperi]